MAVFKKRSSLFIIIAFILILPGIVSGGTILTEPGTCATDEECVCWRTQCWSEDSPEEQFKVGACPDKHCCCEIDFPGGSCLKCWAGVEWEEYKCEAPECERDILVRDCWSYVDCGKCPANDCVDECVCVTCDPIDGELCEECQDWQRPERYPSCIKGAGNDCEKWSRYKKPECLCNGPCLDAPENPRYYNQPLYPLDECTPESEYQMTSNNVYLPVKLDWDDVKGWRDGWKEDKCIRVLDCKTEDKACFEKSSYNLKECRNNCQNKVLGISINGYWLSPYKILKFYREECLKNCTVDYRKNNTTDVEGCKEKCPHRDAKKDQDYCYLQKKEPSYKNYIEVPMGDETFRLLFLEGYAQSYVIKIVDKHYVEGKEKEDYEKGEIRDPEALKKIDELESFIEEERKKDRPNWQEIEKAEEAIKKIRKESLEINSWIEVARQSEFIPPSPCFLKSNRTYKWKTRICCPLIKEVMSNEDFNELVKQEAVTCPGRIAEMILGLMKDGVFVEGALDDYCGPWSEEWQLTTTPAPEPKLPYDPDWAGDGIGRNVPQAEIEKLKWCEIDDPDLYRERTRLQLDEIFNRPLSYRLLTYYSKDRVNINDLCHPNLQTVEGCTSLRLSETGDSLFPPYEFWDKNNNFFTKITPYAWKVTACADPGGMECPYFGANYYSQLWRFEAEDFVLTKPSLLSPGNDPDGKNPLGLPVLLQWSSPYAMSWKYEISDGKGIRNHKTQSLTLDFPQLKLNTLYNWKVQPCWDFESKKCENFWAGPWYFITTGRKPELYYPKDNNIPIPTNLRWEDVPGAKSYIFKIQGDEINIETAVEKSDFSLDYPDLKQEKTYSWQVKTCAKDKDHSCVKDQSCCGEWEGPITFTTFKLEQPSIDKPDSEGKVYTYEPRHAVSWQEVDGARFYQYGVIFSSSSHQDLREECQELEGKPIAEGITQRTSVDLPLKCWGEYKWQVTACLDENCQETGQEGDIWSFNLVAKEAPPEKHGWGLIPCGRDDYDPTTPWYEDEPCGIKHIFIMLYILVNFFLWKIVPLLLLLLAIASGVIFYFSLQTGETNPLAKVKSLWKAAGLGLAVIFLAWIIISLFLAIIGYRVGVLGPWWQI